MEILKEIIMHVMGIAFIQGNMSEVIIWGL